MNFNSFFEGFDAFAYEYMGAHKKDKGVEFYLWAPHAFKVEVFCSKDDFKVFYPLNKIDKRGIWHTFIDNMECIYSYRYRIYDKNNNFVDKSDPYAFYSELRPNNASVMYDLNYQFDDEEYLKRRRFGFERPLNIYEVHVNGFKYNEGKSSYRTLKEELIPYVKQMGFSHIELMPLGEYPFDGSWGYQSTGLFSITSRYGTPWDFMDFVNECHKNDIGVILDVSYVHFATDSYGLGNFDFGPCYEYDDPKKAYSQWGSYYFDLGKGPVISFLMSSGEFYFNKYHIDGLRLDAVSNIIHYDGDKNKGINSNGLSFLKRYNHTMKYLNPDVLMIAEDSSDYPCVTAPTRYNGLGFDYKWDLGWMNDTLKYYSLDPIYKKYHHNLITFSMAYFYQEKYILPFSHDEVVHSKKTIIDKMWGNYETKFSLARNLYLYMYTHPGKKLNFMGNDLAMFREFDELKQMDWFLLQYPIHSSFNRYFKDLNHIYKAYEAFYGNDYNNKFGFKWIDADNADQSIFIYSRYDENDYFLIVLNMTPVSYKDYKVGVPFRGKYTELINSEKDIYNGCNMCNFKPIYSHKGKLHGYQNMIEIDIAPYAGIIFRKSLSKQIPTEEINNIIVSNTNEIKTPIRAKGEY